MGILKIGYFADGIWGHNTFLQLIKCNFVKIDFVCVRYDMPDNTLAEMAQSNNIPLLCHKNINSDEFLNLVSKYQSDLFVSMSFNQIFKTQILEMPKLGIINCHAGKLPFYRGRNILNWALINDEKEFGITVHYVDEGIDTGDIILQKTFKITDDDNYQTLLECAYKNCPKLVYDAIMLIENNEVKRIAQDTIHPVGLYCGKRIKGDEVINWNQTSREIFNFVRAICRPGPMAQSFINGVPIFINKVGLVKGAINYKNTIGLIVGKTQTTFFVKTLDTMIEVLEYEYSGIVKIGDRLG